MAQSSGSFPPYSSPVREEGGYQRFDHGRDNGFERDRPWNSRQDYVYHQDTVYRRDNLTAFDSTSSVTRDDPWSCVVVILTFCFFGSMTLVLGVFGSENIRLGPNSSLLIRPNSIFVQSIQVEQLDGTDLKLYGFYENPPLDVKATWSDIHYLAVPTDSYKYWVLYLNEGSHLNLSYKVESVGSPLYLVIAQGTEGLAQWVEDPTHPNTTLSWNVVHGSGVIQLAIHKSSSYYIAVGNIYLEEVKATLDIQVSALLYNTTEAYYMCNFPDGRCSLNMLLPRGSSAVLSSPNPQQTSSKEFRVKVSYGPRWMAYMVCMGALAGLLLVVFSFINNRFSHEGDSMVLNIEAESADRVPFLSSKDDLSSWCSSYSSILTSTEDIETIMAGQEGENRSRNSCAICFDAPKDCFFIPCGHCMACIQCGTRMAEAAGNCPSCHRKIKKVRKIFTV